MRVCLCSVPKNGIRPVYLHQEVARIEKEYRGSKKVDVEREYVWGLAYSPREERIEPVRYFTKDIGSPYLVVADDLHSHLMSKGV